MLECVANLSEGRDPTRLQRIGAAAAPLLLDLHADAGLNRCVLTMAGEPEELQASVATVARLAVALLDIGDHEGAHPRLGVVDVVPFVDLDAPASPATSRSLSARDRFAEWAAEDLGVPAFLYGPERSLPEIRREAWRVLSPDRGPARPHPTAGATCVGARGALIAYNLVLATADLGLARQAARAVRSPGLRALAFPTEAGAMVSCNLTEPYRLGPAEAYDAVAAEVGTARIARAELVGLLPAGVLRTVPAERWPQLGIGPDRTIEAALEASHQARPRSW